MKSRFTRFRKALAFVAAAVPILCLLGFLLFAYGLGWASLAAFLPSLVLHLCFPVGAIARPGKWSPQPFGFLWNLLWTLPLFLAGNWLNHQPELRGAVDRLGDGPLRDWRAISAATFWTAAFIRSRWTAASLLGDRAIFDYLKDGHLKLKERESHRPESF